MKVTYELTEKEEAFLRALRTKEYPKNAWSGRMSDDAFIKEYQEEISAFQQAGLTKHMNPGSESFWEFGLNKKGLDLQSTVLPLENEG